MPYGNDHKTYPQAMDNFGSSSSTGRQPMPAMLIAAPISQISSEPAGERVLVAREGGDRLLEPRSKQQKEQRKISDDLK